MAAANGSTTTGMRCFETENRCRFSSCSVTDGTGANPLGPCACGESDCSDTTGLHCDVLDATSQCKHYPYCLNTDGSADNAVSCTCGSPPMAYHLVTSGTCPDNGFTWIEDLAECEAAAVALGLSDTSAVDDGRSEYHYYPKGCYEMFWNLKLNVAGTNTGSCSFWRKCLCGEPTDADCVVNGTTGLRCFEAEHRCRFANCSF